MSRRMDRITDEAAIWYVRAQDPGFSDEDRRELASWLSASAEHVREYLSLAAVTHDLRQAAEAYDVDQLVALAREDTGDANVIELLDSGIRVPEGLTGRGKVGVAALPEPASARRRPAFWRVAAGIALASVVAALAYVQHTKPDPDLFITGVGEQVSFPLDDGSVITLNAQSTLRVAYSDEYRDIQLTAGEAIFDVAKDPGRPFRVITGRAVIQAIGTQFNVRNRGGGTTVTVVEGIVDVHSASAAPALAGEAAQVPDDTVSDPPAIAPAQPTRLAVGQQLRVNGGEMAVIEASVHKATSWRERRLVFEAWALEDVVKEFNLYNDHPFVIDDPGLAERAISGTFSADDRDSFALFLGEAGLAVSERRNDGTIVLRLGKHTE